ncbi:serine/threonine-protein kinase [Streptomyces sp. JNUCC 64]
MSGGDAGRRVIDGRFALEARLGGGGMGMVWRARDLVLDRAVALKEVRPPDPGLAEYDPEAARLLRARVLREARALARVEHPNVVTIHHVVDGGEDTYPWLVMELVTGGSLQDRLERGPMGHAEAAWLGRELLAALSAAHAVGIQHRDVKPANVLLRPDGRPVLTDFGIAAIRESTVLTATGSIIGTPDYMAPERITGERGGPGSDLWSLAMMLYVAVEGHHPLRRATTLATLAAVLNEQLPPPVQAGPLTPVLVAVLAKDPAVRPGPEEMDRMLAVAALAAGPSGPGAVPGSVPGAAPPYAGAGAGPFAPPPPAVPDASGAPDPSASGAAGPVTSYRLTPPPGAYGAAGVPGGAGAYGGAGGPGAYDGTGGPTAPFGPPTAPLGDPYAHPYKATVGTGSVGSAAPGGGRPGQGRARRRVAVAVAVVGVLVAGAVLWKLVPLGGGGGEDVVAERTGPSARTASAGPAGGTEKTPSSAAARTPERTTGGNGDGDGDDGGGEGDGGSDKGGDEGGDLLTPDGIRRAVGALREETGSDRFGDLNVYPEHVTATVMVKGSDKKFDRYVYRATGITKLPVGGTLMGGDQPMDITGFDWDVVPALLERAGKDLNVDRPTSRYLLVNGPSATFGTPSTLSVYFSDGYGSGYLQADTKGKVTKVYPAES